MEDGIGKEFMEKTKYQHLGSTDQQKGIPQPDIEEPVPENAKKTDLPSSDALEIPEISLRAAIEERRSLRNYSEAPLSLEQLSYLLWTTQGVKRLFEKPGIRVTMRTVPSAGARHPFETYLLVNRVQGLEPGLYRYLALSHQLLHIPRDDDIHEKLHRGCMEQMIVPGSAVTFFWSAAVYRMSWRYHQRSWRYIHLDAGHVCQNLYLAAEQIGGGACGIGAYDDDIVNDAIGLDGTSHFVVYACSVGLKPAKS